MKKLILACTFALFSVAAFAQLDLEATSIVSPASGTSVTSGNPFTVKFAVTNTGTTTLNTGDSIFYRIDINGGIVTIGGANIFYIILSKTVAPNDSVHISVTANIDFWNFGQGALANSSTFTIGFNVRGTTCCPSLDDANLANNQISLTLTNGSLSNDELEAVELETFYSNNEFHVEFLNIGSAIDVNIYNLTGKLVKTAALTGSEDIDLSDLPQGVYISKIVSKNKLVETKKFVK
tara:strand:+ start:7897 stop:8604 length:708 start_codon:yes stop_codon:yes gene_type:complete